MADKAADTSKLTKNQKLVFETLNKSETPLSAYAILDQLRDHGLRAPLQVYRALDKLVEFGMVHRLESLNAFVRCSHLNCKTDETVVFMICEKCDQVSEIADDSLIKKLTGLAKGKNFKLKKSTVELWGACEECK